jgi:RNA-directed DNA polymerase
VTDSVVDTVANYIGFNREETLYLSKKAPKTYRHYTIPKKKGGHRIIHHPSKQTKALQYALIEVLLSKLQVHHCAAAYNRNIKSPLLRNANLHAEFSFSVRMDFTDFFHTITPQDLFKQITRNKMVISSEDLNFIEDCLFIKLLGGRMGLAIGAPSSPLISNIVMYSLDESIEAIANRISKETVYSRYADDIVFSTNSHEGCQQFYQSLYQLIRNTKSPKLIINEDKTVFASRANRRVVTGLFICPDGRVSLGRRNKRYIRKLLFELKNGAISKEGNKYLSGYLAFVLDVEPDFYNRLAIKYGADILKKALT